MVHAVGRAAEPLARALRVRRAPLENAARKNPYNAEYEYGELIAQKITADAAKLKAAGTPEDAAPLLQKLVESTDAYCQTLNCANLLIYR